MYLGCRFLHTRVRGIFSYPLGKKCITSVSMYPSTVKVGSEEARPTAKLSDQEAIALAGFSKLRASLSRRTRALPYSQSRYLEKNTLFHCAYGT
jgi:hypothetical protein